VHMIYFLLSILLRFELGCRNPPFLEDQRPCQSIASQERSLLATPVYLVLAYTYRTSSYQHTYHTVSLLEDPCAMHTTHVPDPYTTVSFSTDPYVS
jgi:hypothetical protein